MEKTYEFQFEGRRTTVVVPDNANGEWVWKAEFFHAFDQAERALYDDGYTRVYHSVSDRYGSYENLFTGVRSAFISADDFAATMQSAVQGNMWMCGFPERLVIASIGGEYVVVAFGVNDAMTPFFAHLGEAYADAQILVDEPIA